MKAHLVRGIDIDSYLIDEAKVIAQSQAVGEYEGKISFVCEDFMKEGYFQGEFLTLLDLN